MSRLLGKHGVGLAVTVLGALWLPGCMGAQQHGTAASQGTVHASAPQPGETATTSAEGTLVDQVLAVVNGDLILESDVNEEKRFQAFQPYVAQDDGRDAEVERLIDRDLILQQAKLQPDDAVTHEQAVAQLATLRKDIPACKQFHCETDEGWAKFVSAQGFTMDELINRWQERMQILKFIEIRFRSGILDSEAGRLQDYYEKTLLPEYAKQHATAPKLDGDLRSDSGDSAAAAGDQPAGRLAAIAEGTGERARDAAG